jgi:hypothetical protein
MYKPPVVADTTMAADLLEMLEILTQLGVYVVGEELSVLAVTTVLLSVEEPIGDLVLAGVLHDGHKLVDLNGIKIN